MVQCYTSTSSTTRYRFKRIRCNGGHVQYPAWRWTLWWGVTPILCHVHFGSQIQVHWCQRCHWPAHAPQHTAKANLLQVLLENAQMFDGTLGMYPHKKVHLELDHNTKRYMQGRTPCLASPVHFQKRIGPSHCTRHAHFAKRKWMGISHFHHTKKGWTSPLDQQPLST